ncbi:MAG: HipA domain-containing protein [Gammaproteobacteria bacterium]|nr:HipA domain-containing protein [Gammaproteobacteria bacterium]
MHQEDMLQALGEPTALKYEEDGGPSLRQIAQLIDDHVRIPAKDRIHLRDWQIFNLIIGNRDGHAKNLSLIYQKDSAAPSLAPFYDLVSIEFLNDLGNSGWGRRLAFRIGRDDIPERVGQKNWESFAEDLQLPVKPTLRQVVKMCDVLPDAAEEGCRDIGSDQIRRVS